MKKLYILLFTILISSLSFGQVIKADGFDYPDGSLVPNGGWTSISGTSGDLLVSSGQAVVQHGVPSEDAELGFTSVSGDIYFGFDFSVDDLGAPYSGTDNEYFAHASFKARMDIVPGTSGGDYTVGISSSTSTAQAIWSTDLTFGQVYRAIIKFDQVSGTAQLWIDPTVSTDTSISGTADGAATVNSFDLRQSDSSENETVRVDNLMIGQTFNDVLVFAPPTDPTLTLNDGPANGEVLTGDPETVNNADIDFNTTNFTMSTDAGGGTGTGGDGFIKWTLKTNPGGNTIDFGNIFTSNDPLTTYPVNGLLVGQTYDFRAELVDNTGAPLSSPVVYSFTITIATYTDVPDLATLRTQTVDPDLYYRVTGEVFNTYSRTNRNQKYFQDATGGILVDDADFIISTVYSEGDGVTNMRGHLEVYNGLVQFIPTDNDNWGKSSTGGTITPDVVTISTVATNLGSYESKLVRINNVTFADGNGINTFTSSTNYNIDDGTTSTFRTTFFEADYIGQTIPSGANSLLAIVGNFNGNEQFTARSLSELTLSTKYNQITGFAMYPNPTSLGYVNITSKNNAKMQVAVFDMLGKQVLNKTISNNTLNVSSLTSGIYLMKVSQDNAITTRKLVIQ